MTRVAVLLVASILSTVTVTAVALATQLHYRDVAWAEAIADAPMVVAGEVTALPPNGPIEVTVRRWIRGGRRANRAIVIDSLEAWAWSTIAAAERATGVRRSPILQRLTNPPPLAVGGQYCFLLREDPFGEADPRDRIYTLHVANGYALGNCGWRHPRRR